MIKSYQALLVSFNGSPPPLSSLIHLFALVYPSLFLLLSTAAELGFFFLLGFLLPSVDIKGCQIYFWSQEEPDMYWSVG